MRIHNIQATILAATLCVFPAAAFAQAPLLGISQPTLVSRNTPRGTVQNWQVTLTNNYTAPVTAYALRFSEPRGMFSAVRVDSIPSPGMLRRPILPGQSASQIIPGRPSNQPTVENTGVIYADGATAGRAEIVAHFLLVRAAYLAELPPTIQRLAAIASNPAADRTSVLAHFHQQKPIEVGMMQDDVTGPRAARVSGTIIATLTRFPKDNLQHLARNLAGLFSGWLTQLQQSKPKLQALDFPAIP